MELKNFLTTLLINLMLVANYVHTNELFTTKHGAGSVLLSSKQPNLACPKPWIALMLLPCRCDPDQPTRLLCVGSTVSDETIAMMEWRIRFAIKHSFDDLRARFIRAFHQFDTLMVANSYLTKLDSPVFQHFPIRNLILDSDHFLQQVHLQNTFTNQLHKENLIQLDNFNIFNMNNVAIDP